MLGINGTPQANLSGAQVRGTQYRVRWIQIPNPKPQFRWSPASRLRRTIRPSATSASSSPPPSDLHLPDNVTASNRGTLILCEDNPGPNRLQALTKGGDLITFAERADLPAVEFAGATFDPFGRTLFVNLNASSALSVAIWGPWHTLRI